MLKEIITGCRLQKLLLVQSASGYDPHWLVLTRPAWILLNLSIYAYTGEEYLLKSCNLTAF